MDARRPAWSWLFFVQLALVVGASALATLGKLPTTLFQSPFDKVGHLFAYGGLAFLAVSFFGYAHRWRVVLLLLSAAALEELSQRWLPARTFDFGDLAMNAIGICGFGALAARLGLRRAMRRSPSPEWEDAQRANSFITWSAGWRVALGAIYVLAMWNWRSPVVRFTSPLANSLTFAALQLIPLVILFLAMIAEAWWAALVWLLVLSPVLGIAGTSGLCAAVNASSIAATGVDSSFELLERVPLPRGHLAIYRTNGGARTSFGIAVRQECRLLPGVAHVRPVWGAYPAYRVRTRVLADDRIEFAAAPYGDRRPRERVEEVTLAPFWCP